MKQTLRLMGLLCPKSNHYNIKLPNLILAILLFSCVQTRAQRPEPSGPVLSGKDTLATKKDTTMLEEVEINAGYYTVKDRERTGSIGRVDAQTIARQPVSNTLAALHGQIAGVEVTQHSGAPGAAINLRIRGQNSLLNGSDPLYLIDGVPFMAGQQPINELESVSSRVTVSNTTAGISPLSMLNPADISSIEILKDADATAIYGSRGANGVVLITTHKAAQQSPKINAQYRTGLSRPSRLIEVLSGAEYLAMRREAFANDGIEPDATVAPDLMLWDTTSTVDFAELLLPEYARYHDAQLSVRGGNPNASFLISGSYHSESTVFDRRTANSRLGLHSTGSLRNAAGTFSITGTVNLANTTFDLPLYDVTRFLRFFPFATLYQEDGSLAWDIGGTPYYTMGLIDGNPLAMRYRNYDAGLFNLVGQVSVVYDIIKNLRLKTDIGTNLTYNDEWNASSSTALDPHLGARPNASFSMGSRVGWTVEPQLDYRLNSGKNTFSALLGATWQNQSNASRTASGSNYANDLLLGSIAAAGDTYNHDRNSQYRYQGAYARLNANLSGRYILNLTGRRDGSSRFSPENRYANFAAIGAAWLLDAEPFMQWAQGLDMAKLRASYGITGNDQIGDYQYVDTWSISTRSYEGLGTLDPTALYNPNYVWERNRKFEIGFESGVLDNRLQVQVAYYRNISDNQLVQYTLPNQTGFLNVIRNHQATILNAGWEFQFAYRTKGMGRFHWQTAVNATLPKNKLLDFPDLETSSYRTRYVIGEPLTTRLGYQYLGVNPQTGLYDYVDVDGNGIFNTADAIFPVRQDQRLFGGWNNTFTYGQWSIMATVDFKLQEGYNYLYSAGVAGYNYTNQPKFVLQRWQREGDITNVQRFTAVNGEARQRALRLASSGAVISDASYARLRNVSVAFDFPSKLISPLRLTNCRVSCQAQNLLLITRHEGTDPESQAYLNLPPMRTVVFALELMF